MKQAKWGRKGKTIENVESGEIEQFKYINAAKRESRKRQMAEDGALGRGSMRVAR